MCVYVCIISYACGVVSVQNGLTDVQAKAFFKCNKCHLGLIDEDEDEDDGVVDGGVGGDSDSVTVMVMMTLAVINDSDDDNDGEGDGDGDDGDDDADAVFLQASVVRCTEPKTRFLF